MLTDICFKFALESLKKCTLMEPKESIFFSPNLIYQNLICVYFAARGDIENSLRQVLCIPNDISKNYLELRYKSECDQLCYRINEPSCICKTFSLFYINDTHILNQKVVQLFMSGHQMIKNTKFDHDTEKTVNFINAVVKSVTQGCIRNLLPPKSIDKNTDILMIKSIYLKGQLNFNCDIKYDDSNRKNTKDDGNSKNDIFNNGKSEQLNAYITELPFDQQNISIFFLNPLHYLEYDENNSAKNDTIIQLMERLLTEEGCQILRKLLDDGIQKQASIFPTFEIEQDMQICQLLEMLGVRELTPFGSKQVDLSGFTFQSNVKLGNAMHRVNIKLQGDRIIAAASNALFTNNSWKHFRTDRIMDVPFPCICLIYDRSHRNILFCGILFSKANESEAADNSECKIRKHTLV